MAAVTVNGEEEDFEIINGPIPGQVGRVFTVWALAEDESFTNPEHDPLLTKIQYSTQESAAAGLLNQDPHEVESRSGGSRRLKWKNIAVCLCLLMAYTLCNTAYSIINPFFPQVVSVCMLDNDHEDHCPMPLYRSVEVKLTVLFLVAKFKIRRIKPIR
jgi:hypothetical protein